MHRPPAASWKVGAVRYQWRLLLLLVVLTALQVAGFLATQAWGPGSVLLLLTFAGVVGFALMGLRRVASGQLLWDGAQWFWAAGRVQTVTELVCVLDLQRVMLLRIRCAQTGRHWLWLESAQMGHGWKALRRAVAAGMPLSDTVPATGHLG
jgi:hypothetical protein